MAQRLMVARAIMHDPDVLFLDEPTSGLDPQSRLALWDVIGELHAQGQTIVLTTHYMEEADQLCERVAIIDHGTPARARHAGEPEGRRSAPRPRCASRRPATSQSLADELEQMHGRRRARACVDDTVYANVTRGGPDAARDLITHADHNGFAISDVGIKETTLETVFIDLTGRDLRE